LFNLEAQATGTGTHLSNLLLEECGDIQNYAETIADLSSNEDGEVLASDVVLVEGDEVPNGDLKDIFANKDEVFVSQVIEEKNMSERREGKMHADRGLDEVEIYGNEMEESKYILNRSFTFLLG